MPVISFANSLAVEKLMDDHEADYAERRIAALSPGAAQRRSAKAAGEGDDRLSKMFFDLSVARDTNRKLQLAKEIVRQMSASPKQVGDS